MGAIDYDGFAAFLLRQGRRNTTIRKHISALRYLEHRLGRWDKAGLEKLLLQLKSEGKQPSYLNGFVFVARLYGEFSGTDLKLKEFRRFGSVKATLSDEEIEAFLALPRRPHQSTAHHTRMKVFWSIMADTGMRPGEVAKLSKKHIDWGRSVIVIDTSKTNQWGHVPIPNNLKELLGDYLESLPTELLFPSARGGTHYSMDGFAVIDNNDWHYDWVKRLAALDIRRPHLTPYSFRHSYATRLLEEEVSLFHVKKLMRHNDLKSTLVYEHLTTKDLIKAQAKLPRVRKSSNPKEILKLLMEHIKSFSLGDDPRFAYRIEENDNSIKVEVYIK